MGFYNERVAPYLIALAMRQRNLAEYRHRLVPTAHGRVLEIGIGSGLNLPFYGAAVEHIFGLDPSSQLLAMAERRVRRMHEKVTLIEGAAEAIPLEDGASRKVSRACGGRRLWHDGEYQSICNARPQHGAPHVSICIATAPAPLCGLAYNKRSRSEQEPRGLPRCSLAALPIAL